MRCGEVPMLKAANFGYGKFISCSLTENSGQKLLPTNMHRMARRFFTHLSGRKQWLA